MSVQKYEGFSSTILDIKNAEVIDWDEIYNWQFLYFLVSLRENIIKASFTPELTL